ncbi:MAG: DUF3291 domain-containing protein [Cyclobacteriaceae bacterium]
MKLSITYLKLRSPLKIFNLISLSSKIMKQLDKSNCLGVKTKGIWKKHYTMTLWEDESEMKGFYTSGAHAEAMKASKTISKEIKTITIDRDSFLDWKSAIQQLENGRIIRFGLDQSLQPKHTRQPK